MTKQKRDIQSFTFKGIITGTSNKISEEFKNDNPRKTCYIKVDEENEKILLDQGLTKYTAREEKVDFFIIKFSEIITLWCNKEKTQMDTSTVSPNFFTENEISFACIKGKHKGNEYVRIYALGLNSLDHIIIHEETNPFEDDEDFTPSDEAAPF